MRKRIVIVGGGISGLSAAHRIVELSRENNLDLELILLEAGQRAGGVIHTIEKDGCLIELGPDSFITTKPWALDLSKRLGLSGELIGTQEGKRRSFVLMNRRLVPLPEGFHMLAPGSIKSFLMTPLFSWYGKARMLMDLVIPKKSINDESLASFVRRRLGVEAFERAAQPMIGGVYTADPETLSLRATMPQFIEMEEKYGSVIKGIYSAQRQNTKEKKDGGARYSMFLSFKKGLNTLIEAILEKLPKSSVHLNQKAEGIERTEKGFNVITQSGVEKADGVIITTPSYITGKLLEHMDPGLAQDLRKIEYASSAIVISVYKREYIADKMDGFGFVVPSSENSSLLACSYSSVKFAGRAPEGLVILRSFVGGALDPAVLELEDREITQIVEQELSTTLRITGGPEFSILQRYPNAMPQYKIGHLDTVQRIEKGVKELPGLEIAGIAYRGVGIPDCVHSGEMAAEEIMDALFNNSN
jgi:protoporphyrinogen/coproporphyrinogen III oxidase